VIEHRKDDVGTMFYRCKNNHETATPLKKEYKPQMWRRFESWCDAKGAFNPALLAQDIVNNYALKTDMISDTLYFYDAERGVYDRNGDIIVRALIENCLESEDRQHRTTETIYLVHSKTLQKIEPGKKITVLNGLLNVESGEISAFTPTEFIIYQLPVRYDPSATCPEITRFFNEIAPADLTPQFEEVFGYCLLQELPIHKATVLLGEGRNGKTTFLNLLTAFLGRENVSHVSLQEMCEGKFELAELKDKLTNIVDDLPGRALKAVGTFKWVTGNAPIMAQYKHKNPFTFWPTAKHLFGCNKLPKPSEDTIAYFSRFNIIPFSRLFIGKTDDKDKLKKMTTPAELSGLLNLALAGLKRLLKNGDYSNSKTIEENRELYIRSSDSCKAFAEEQLEESDDPKDYISTEAIYQDYIKYCQEKRLPTIETKPKLTQSIRQTFPNAEQVKQRVKTGMIWVWRYLKKKIVPTVPTVPGTCILEIFTSKSKVDNKEEHGTSGTVGTPNAEVEKVANHEVEERVCGRCAVWHKPGCSYPDADSSCVAPTNKYAADCRDYIPKERGSA
jgi:P4 family phage/plasmid primase-like protien